MPAQLIPKGFSGADLPEDTGFQSGKSEVGNRKWEIGSGKSEVGKVSH